MAAHREFSWPPARSFVSAYKENLMAADTVELHAEPTGQVESQRVVYELSGSDGSRINLS